MGDPEDARGALKPPRLSVCLATQQIRVLSVTKRDQIPT